MPYRLGDLAGTDRAVHCLAATTHTGLRNVYTRGFAVRRSVHFLHLRTPLPAGDKNFTTTAWEKVSLAAHGPSRMGPPHNIDFDVFYYGWRLLIDKTKTLRCPDRMQTTLEGFSLWMGNGSKSTRVEGGNGHRTRNVSNHTVYNHR